MPYGRPLLDRHAAIAVLSKVVEDDVDPKVRFASILAIHRLGVAPYSKVPMLMEALSDPDQFIREEAAETLGQIMKSGVRVLAGASGPRKIRLVSDLAA